jgi:hypothetical protein
MASLRTDEANSGTPLVISVGERLKAKDLGAHLAILVAKGTPFILGATSSRMIGVLLPSWSEARL